MNSRNVFIALFCTLLSFSAQALPKKIVLVVFENTTYTKALQQPYFTAFANSGVLLTNYHAVGHPSQPNYIALVSGSTQNVTGDANRDISAQSIVDLLEAKNKTWHVYSEGFRGSCYLGGSSGLYARKHNPLISFTNIQSNPTRCANITDERNFISDFQNRNLADFTMYVPDLKNDGHNTGSAYADKWFKNTFDSLLKNPTVMQDVLVIATFDEDDNHNKSNQVFTALVGPDVKVGVQISDKLDHYSLLRTIEDILQIGNLGLKDSQATPITGFLN